MTDNVCYVMQCARLSVRGWHLLTTGVAVESYQHAATKSSQHFSDQVHAQCTITLSLVFRVNTSVQNIANFVFGCGMRFAGTSPKLELYKSETVCISICVVLQNVRFRPQHVYCYFELLRRFLRTALFCDS